MALASCDARGRIAYDPRLVPLADGGLVREPRADELIERAGGDGADALAADGIR